MKQINEFQSNILACFLKNAIQYMQLVKLLESNNPQFYKALRVSLHHAKGRYVDGIKTYSPKEFRSFDNLPTPFFQHGKD